MIFWTKHVLIPLQLYIAYKKNQQILKLKILNSTKSSYVPKCLDTSKSYTTNVCYLSDRHKI